MEKHAKLLDFGSCFFSRHIPAGLDQAIQSCLFRAQIQLGKQN